MHFRPLSTADIPSLEERAEDVALAASYCRARRAHLDEKEPVLRRCLGHVEVGLLRALVGQCDSRATSAIAKRVHTIHVLSVLREGIRRSRAEFQPGMEQLAKERLDVLSRRIHDEVVRLEQTLPAAPSGSA